MLYLLTRKYAAQDTPCGVFTTQGKAGVAAERFLNNEAHDNTVYQVRELMADEPVDWLCKPHSSLQCPAPPRPIMSIRRAANRFHIIYIMERTGAQVLRVPHFLT